MALNKPTTVAGFTRLTDSSAGTASASAVGAIPSLTDSPATADALRDDIVTNVLPAIRNDFATLAAKLDEVVAYINRS